MVVHNKNFNFIFCTHLGPLLSPFHCLVIINAYCINSCIDSFPRFCQKRPVAVKNIFATTCYIKFRWFQFLRHEEETKWPQYFQCGIVCTALVNSPGYKATPTPNNIATVRFVCTKLHNIPATCFLAMDTKGLVPAQRPCSMSSSVRRYLVPCNYIAIIIFQQCKTQRVYNPMRQKSWTNFRTITSSISTTKWQPRQVLNRSQSGTR